MAAAPTASGGGGGGVFEANLVMGWHAYCKDFEHTFTSLASNHGARVHGLNTNPARRPALSLLTTLTAPLATADSSTTPLLQYKFNFGVGIRKKGMKKAQEKAKSG